MQDTLTIQDLVGTALADQGPIPIEQCPFTMEEFQAWRTGPHASAIIASAKCLNVAMIVNKDVEISLAVMRALLCIDTPCSGSSLQTIRRALAALTLDAKVDILGLSEVAEPASATMNMFFSRETLKASNASKTSAEIEDAIDRANLNQGSFLLEDVLETAQHVFRINTIEVGYTEDGASQSD